MKVPAGECAAFWPRVEHENKTLRAKVAGQPEKTAAFIYTDSHTTLLKLDNKVMQYVYSLQSNLENLELSGISFDLEKTGNFIVIQKIS